MQYDVTTASDTSEAGFRRAQLQRKVVMLLLLCGLLVQTVDVFSDVQLYQAIGHAEELERSGATAARLNLTTAGAASPFNVSSPGVLSLNATYANLSAAERAEMCDPVAAAQALSGDAWPAVADTLQGLQRASFIFIIASIVPLLLSFWLAIRQLQTVLQAYRSAETERRTGVQERERRWTRNASIRVVWSQIGVQLLEDVPQSVVSAVFIVTMLAKGGSVCNGCFRDSAPTGEFAAGCGVLVIDSFSWEEALRERDEQSAVALGFSLTMCVLSVFKSALLSGYFLVFRRGLKPRFCCYDDACTNYLFGLPFALALWVLWVASYFCFSLTPIAGSVYFHVGPLLDFPEWEQTSVGFLIVFIVGAALWVGLLVWCSVGLCMLCGEGCG